jgi:hypothetical protein
MIDRVLEILVELQSRVITLGATVAALRVDVAPMRVGLEGLRIIDHAVAAAQHDVRALRDDMRALTAVMMRLDYSHVNLLQELHAAHTQIAHMNSRIMALENPPLTI